MAIGHLFDGNSTLVIGTHTHVPTSDLVILKKGTADFSSKESASDSALASRLFEIDGEEKVVSVGVIRDVDDGHDTEDNKTSGEPQDAETDGFSGEQTTE